MNRHRGTKARRHRGTESSLCAFVPLCLRACASARRGFTLIELTLAVLILALLAGLAAWSFRGPLRRSNQQLALDAVRGVDAMARQHALRFGQRQRVSIESANLPRGYRAEQVRPGAIEVSAQGLSRAYAVKVSGPEFSRWLLVTASGQVTELDDESQVQSILAAAGPHAH